MRTTSLFKKQIWVQTLLKDSSEFKNIPAAPDKDLSYVINSEKRVADLLKETRVQSVKKPRLN